MGGFGVGSGVRFVGRSAELDALRGVVDGAASGRARIAVVEGEAGIGKSRLLAEALGLARGQGFRVLVGACDELERDRPLRALGEAFDVERGAAEAGRAELARLLRGGALPTDPVTHVVGPFDEGWLIVEAVLDVLEELASTGPVVLAVEDLQWADPLTLRAVHVHRPAPDSPAAGAAGDGARGISRCGRRRGRSRISLHGALSTSWLAPCPRKRRGPRRRGRRSSGRPSAAATGGGRRREPVVRDRARAGAR